MEAVLSQLFDVIEQETGCEVTPETKIKDIAKDSLELVSLLGAIEDNFGVKIGSEKLAKLITVGDLYSIVSA